MSSAAAACLLHQHSLAISSLTRFPDLCSSTHAATPRPRPCGRRAPPPPAAVGLSGPGTPVQVRGSGRPQPRPPACSAPGPSTAPVAPIRCQPLITHAVPHPKGSPVPLLQPHVPRSSSVAVPSPFRCSAFASVAAAADSSPRLLDAPAAAASAALAAVVTPSPRLLVFAAARLGLIIHRLCADTRRPTNISRCLRSAREDCPLPHTHSLTHARTHTRSDVYHPHAKALVRRDPTVHYLLPPVYRSPLYEVTSVPRC